MTHTDECDYFDFDLLLYVNGISAALFFSLFTFLCSATSFLLAVLLNMAEQVHTLCPFHGRLLAGFAGCCRRDGIIAKRGLSHRSHLQKRWLRSMQILVVITSCSGKKLTGQLLGLSNAHACFDMALAKPNTGTSVVAEC